METWLTLLTTDGSEVVAHLQPALYTDANGALPDLLTYDGRTFKRGWTSDVPGSDERLWFEVEA